MQTARSTLRLAAGLIGFDILLNLPRLDPASPVLTLLAPSIDLLIVAAACWAIAQAGEAPRREEMRVPHRGARILVCALAAFLLGYAVAARFGLDVVVHLFGIGGGFAAAASVVVSAAMAAAVVSASWFLTGLAAAGFQKPVARNVFLLVVALSAILQVFTRNLVYTKSVLARAVLDLVARLQ